MSSDQVEEYKKITERDRKYLSDINVAVMYGVPVKIHLLSIIIFCFILIGFYWAKYAMLDEVTRGTGKIIPTKYNQTVQNLEGGILAEIYVEEGDRIEKGQALMRLDSIQFSSTLAESELKYYELLASHEQYLAEIEEKDLSLPDDILKNYPALADRVKQLYQSRVEQHKAGIVILEEKAQQKQQAILDR